MKKSFSKPTFKKDSTYNANKKQARKLEASKGEGEASKQARHKRYGSILSFFRSTLFIFLLSNVLSLKQLCKRVMERKNQKRREKQGMEREREEEEMERRVSP